MILHATDNSDACSHNKDDNCSVAMSSLFFDILLLLNNVLY